MMPRCRGPDSAVQPLPPVLLVLLFPLLLLLAVLPIAVSAPPRPPTAAAAAVSFDALAKVGESWLRGRWGRLDARGVQIVGTCGDNGSKPCIRGEPGTTMLQSPGSSPRLLVLSSTAIIGMAGEKPDYVGRWQDRAQISTDGGRAWSRYAAEGRADIYDPYIPSPSWLNNAGFMDIRPVPAYPASCATPTHCMPASPVIAPDDNEYLDWQLSPDGLPVINRSGAGRRRKGANSWGGMPVPVSMFCTECGGGTQLPDGSFVFLVAVQHTDPRRNPHTCCNNSVWAFVSRDGRAWTYTATVAQYPVSRIYQEGFSENSVVLLKDNKTIFTVIRTDSCDGEPSHRTLPFLSATSTDGGHHWTAPQALPNDMLSSTPKATVLGNGALLVAGGRPGVDLWVSLDGFGDTWARYSLPAIHNALATRAGKLDWRYCEPFVSVAANHTFAGDPTPRVDNEADGGALHGWIASSGRVAVAAVEHDVALVTYDRQGW